MDIGILMADGSAMINSVECRSINVDFEPGQIEPWVWANRERSSFICGFRLREAGVSVHLQSVNDLIGYCRSLGVPIAGLLDKIDAARYEMTAA